MPEMLRIDAETDRLIAAIQVTLRIRNRCHVSRIEVVRRALREMVSEMNIPRLTEDDPIDEDG